MVSFRIFKINDKIINKNNNKIGIIKDLFINTIDSILYYVVYEDNTDDFVCNDDLEYYIFHRLDII
jgi:hypothetical protein